MADGIVTNPQHYTRFNIEPITFIMKNGLTFEQGSIIKYTCRAGFKPYEGKSLLESEIIDYGKVARFAEMKINLLLGKDVL